MTAPTLYFLSFEKNCCNEYDVYESHRCQEKGCVLTEERYVTTCLPGKIEEFVENFQDNLVEGIVAGVEVEYIQVGA